MGSTRLWRVFVGSSREVARIEYHVIGDNALVACKRAMLIYRSEKKGGETCLMGNVFVRSIEYIGRLHL